MASASHITIAGDVKFKVTDFQLPDGTKGKALHVFDLDEQKHYEFQMSVESAREIGGALRGDGIVIAHELPNGSGGAMTGG